MIIWSYDHIVIWSFDYTIIWSDMSHTILFIADSKIANNKNRRFQNRRFQNRRFQNRRLQNRRFSNRRFCHLAICSTTYAHMIIWSTDHIASFALAETSGFHRPWLIWSYVFTHMIIWSHDHVIIVSGSAQERILRPSVLQRVAPSLLEQAGLWEWLGAAQEHHKPPAQHRLGGRVPGALHSRL